MNRLAQKLDEILGLDQKPLIQEGLFSDLKQIYAAIYGNYEPNRMILRRTLELLDWFIKKEIGRTKAAITDKRFPTWHRATCPEVALDYEKASRLVKQALASGKLGDAMVAIDTTLSLVHVWGGMIDNLIMVLRHESDHEHDELCAFLRSMGKFPAPVNISELLHQGKTVEEIKELLQACRIDRQKAKSNLFQLAHSRDA